MSEEIVKLTDRELNLALAAALGLRKCICATQGAFFCTADCLASPQQANFVADCANKLDCIRPVVLELSNTKWHLWRRRLNTIVQPDKDHIPPTKQIICASARQWAEAYLMTVRGVERKHVRLAFGPMD